MGSLSLGKCTDLDPGPILMWPSWGWKTVCRRLPFLTSFQKHFCCCCSVAKSYPTLCDLTDCSTPGFPVLYLLEFAQTHVHWVSDDIQPSHSLSLPSPPALNFSQHQGLFSELALHIKWPKKHSWVITPSIKPLFLVNKSDVPWWN